MDIHYPPLNFALVAPGLYRSGHPIPMNYKFMTTLQLQTVIYIGERVEEYEYYQFLSQNGIKLVHIPLENGFQDSFSSAVYEQLSLVLSILLNKDNYPVLVHSNKGKHRVGVVVGLIRKCLQNWALTAVYDEYLRFTREKSDYDLEFIEFFNPKLTFDSVKIPLTFQSRSLK